ncbi:hypothetical protein J502_3159 [Acinetobacter sp. 1294596]|uniref:GNAT family N-acetyltransferase n=1 Tax=Acinetobacter sp. 1294596 TaxID=1310603 RepID=UPI00044A31F2|nr:GNAT family N-acetyltransferase [Acinetobacter sp. 1294596]EXF55735.1 hypothetical protein J502_3159 [Acinetobacter sp. 1294596]HEE6439629.1 GNAT family N-acetyltransferase [Acinetobacter baumannii]
MDIAELKKQIVSGAFPELSGNPSVIVSENIKNNITGENHSYEIRKGFSLVAAISCDTLWGEENLKILEEIDSHNFSEEILIEIFDKVSFEDEHWDWFGKALHFSQKNGYEWFFLYIDQKPQGACLIYQPKDGALNNSPIFYVEFIAVAPWNRKVPYVRERQFKGVGAILLNKILHFCVNNTGLNPGFCLHSLPKAEPFYTSLKMLNVPSFTKDGLVYFELPRTEAEVFLGV